MFGAYQRLHLCKKLHNNCNLWLALYILPGKSTRNTRAYGTIRFGHKSKVELFGYSKGILANRCMGGGWICHDLCLFVAAELEELPTKESFTLCSLLYEREPQ